MSSFGLGNADSLYTAGIHPVTGIATCDGDGLSVRQRDNPLLKKLNIAVAVVAATAIVYLALSLAQLHGVGLPSGVFFNVGAKYVGIGSAAALGSAVIAKFVLWWQKNRQPIEDSWIIETLDNNRHMSDLTPTHIVSPRDRHNPWLVEG